MATGETTTLRVPVELRDEIAQIAEERGTTMLDVVADAIRRLSRDEWWASVHAALDQVTDAQSADHEREVAVLNGAAADGLRET